MKYIAIDIETRGLEVYGAVIWMLSVTIGKKTSVYHNCNGLTLRDIPSSVITMLKDPDTCKIVHSGEFDLPVIEKTWSVKITNIWDTCLVEKVIQAVQLKPKEHDEEILKRYSARLLYVLPRYGFPKPDKSIREAFIDRPKGRPFTKTEIEYAKDDTKSLPEIQKAQEYLLTRDGGLEVALLENKVVEVVADMRVRGVGFDKVRWLENADRNLQLYNRLTRALPKEVNNWGSPKQVKEYFFNRGVLIDSYENLDKIYEHCKDRILEKFIEARGYYSAATSFGAVWLVQDGKQTVDPDGRIRASIEQVLNTGRISMSRPNLLAIPKEGLQRSAFIPRPGHVFVSGDFSGQELGSIASASGQDEWIDTLLRGESIHSLIASLLFPVEWSEDTEKGCTFPKKCKCKGHQDITGKPYFKAKKLNFMLAYGGGPEKYSSIAECDMLTAKVVIKKYKKLIPRINKMLEENGAEALRTGLSFSADPYKRRRVINDSKEDWQRVNIGKNNPIQAAGANMLKLALISVPKEFPIVLFVHDEIWLEVPNKGCNKAAKTLKTVMEQAADYITGIKGLVKVTPRISNSMAK